MNRKGWSEAANTCHNNEDDELLIDDVFEDERFIEDECED